MVIIFIFKVECYNKMLVINNFYIFYIEKWKSCFSCKLDIVEIKILCE